MNQNYVSDKNFNEIIQKFNEINKKGYIKGINKSGNSCGLTFENEIGKKPDSKYSPDFKDIEIKCKQKNSRFNITMFSMRFNGPYYNESKCILEKYGKKDKLLPSKNILYIKLRYDSKVFYNNYYFELKIDYKNNMLFINVYDINLKFIEKRGYISLSTLQRRVNLKMKKLAIIKSYKKRLMMTYTLNITK